LAGYAVECVLKALILEATPRGRRRDVSDSFRGAKGHDFDWLRAEYSKAGGSSNPAEIVRAFDVVNRWTIVLRYEARTAGLQEATAFIRAVRQIVAWADGRM
jgi:hypothetical protein